MQAGKRILSLMHEFAVQPSTLVKVKCQISQWNMPWMYKHSCICASGPEGRMCPTAEGCSGSGTLVNYEWQAKPTGESQLPLEVDGEQEEMDTAFQAGEQINLGRKALLSQGLLA